MRKRPKALDPDFGPRLKRAIDDVPGLTVVAFANQINVKEQTVWAWIRGDYEPSSYRWGTIAERLGTPVKELFHVSDSRAENGKDSAASTDGVKEFETNVAENGQGTDELPPKRLERTDMEKKLRAIRDILKQPISDSVKLRLIDALVPESEDATESGFHAGTRTS